MIFLILRRMLDSDGNLLRLGSRYVEIKVARLQVNILRDDLLDSFPSCSGIDVVAVVSPIKAR